MSKSPYTIELREKIAKEYLAGDASSVELANKFGEKLVNAIQSKGYINIVDEIMGMSFTVRNGSLGIKVVSYN